MKEFIVGYSLSGTYDIKGYSGIVLLHELGHIVTQLPSGVDQSSTESSLGEQGLAEVTPQILTK